MAKIRTKARALDMLGRQQIAGIPTALSELFKNAHDAYADNVEVDYIRKKNLLILRDDGLGMTRQEFEDRWLTIGTDSKFEDEDSLSQPAVDSLKDVRQVMGEKGIGRLAIAAIGPQVLVLTRAKRESGLESIVAAFINWTLFSFPALDLEDIEIPILEKDSGELTKGDVDSLLYSAKNNVLALSGKISDSKVKAVIKQIELFDYDPELWNSRLNQLDKGLGLERDNLRLDQQGHGTHFFISPVDDVLPEEIGQVETNYRTDQASRLEKALLGFTNTMKGGTKPPIIARFRDHTLEGECIDRISESIFFTPNEFKSADHHFKGSFNEFGQFKGSIKVFGKEVEEAVVPWLSGKNKETVCGPFEINFASIQGLLKDTRLPPEQWKELDLKTSRIGGLYIYRDGIRVLPYGDSDVDFLKIELRRSKSAREYYFSYRKMLGYIELTKQLNSSLQEKAGREGFIENRAYKQFRSILENFFIQIAAAYFLDKGDMSDLFIEQRERHQDQYKLLKKREDLKTTKKKKLKKNLEEFFSKFDDGHWQHGSELLEKDIEHLFNEYEESKADFDDFVYEVQQYLKVRIDKLKRQLVINIPPGIGFGKEITDNIDRYQIYKGNIEENLSRIERETESRLVEFEDRFGNRTGLRRRFSDSLDAQQEFHRKQLNEIYKKANDSIESLTKWVNSELKSSRVSSRSSIDKVKEEFASTSFSGKSSEELYQLKHSLESKIEKYSEKIISKVEVVMSQLNAAHEGTEENVISSTKLTAALESEYEHLKEQHENNMEMVQLGMALGVVHHEFNSNIISIRRGLREMQPWAAKNEHLRPTYDKIRIGFDHLDGYLKTFTPLTRRLNRKRISITGKSLSEFVLDVFHERQVKEGVEIICTPLFMQQSLVGFTSTIYPAFVNLIDNAMHWVAKSSGEKKVILDADNDGFVIKDTGPGISTIDIENVFEFGFSRRIGGRGMGLYVTRQTLEKDGFSITLDEYLPSSGAIFRIYPIEGEEK